jgi:hypothetical protein
MMLRSKGYHFPHNWMDSPYNRQKLAKKLLLDSFVPEAVTSCNYIQQNIIRDADGRSAGQKIVVVPFYFKFHCPIYTSCLFQLNPVYSSCTLMYF